MLGKRKQPWTGAPPYTLQTRAAPSKSWMRWIAVGLPIVAVLGVLWFPLITPVWALVIFWMGTERFEGHGALARGGIAGVLAVFSAPMGMLFLFFPMLLLSIVPLKLAALASIDWQPWVFRGDRTDTWIPSLGALLAFGSLGSLVALVKKTWDESDRPASFIFDLALSVPMVVVGVGAAAYVVLIAM